MTGAATPPRSGANTEAMAIMILAMLIAPLMDVFAKLIATNHPVSPGTITWFRFVGQSAFLFILIALRLGWQGLRSGFVAANLLRGAIMGAASLLFFIAVKYLPLADAIAIFFVEPMMVMFMSAIFLGERVGWRRTLAALTGFGGALLVIQPSWEVFGPVSLLPLGTAFLFSVYLIISRRIGAREHPMTMQLWSGLGGILVCSAAFAIGEIAAIGDFRLTWPTAASVLWMLGAIAALSTVSHLLIVIAFARANDAAVVAPFQYVEIVVLTTFGYLVFGDFPNALKWLGIAIIIASGLYIFFRERKLERSAGT